MTERKVLNKYFPPDYDPSKIPRLPRGKRNRVFNLRTMAPFNMRCLTCKAYIYKARKFNSRMEPVDNEDYLGLRIYRFYIRCSSCCSEISWKTDIANNDYVLESGAIRTFEATRTAYKMAIEKVAQEAEEEKNNPMKLLENRTKQSKNEMDALETLEDLKDQNLRHASLEVADRALDALSVRQAAKERDEEAQIAAEAELLLARQAEAREAAGPSLKISAFGTKPVRKRKLPGLSGVKVKKRNELKEPVKSPEETSSAEPTDRLPKNSELDESVPQTSSSAGVVSSKASEAPSILGGLVHYSGSDSE